MALTKQDVRASLEPDEPNYAEAAERFGAEALPHLKELLDDPRPDIPPKAASLAGLIGGSEAAPVLKKAAAADSPVVRVAAAAAASDLPRADAMSVLATLVQDADAGVQKTALRSVPSRPTKRLRTAIQEMSMTEPFLEGLRDRALGGDAFSADEEDEAEMGMSTGDDPGDGTSVAVTVARRLLEAAPPAETLLAA